jgi:type IV pilus secretin PilQ/predicted competence protein
MKTRFPIVRNQVLNLIKGSIFTLLLFNLALAVPKMTAGAGEPKTSGEKPASSAEIGSITDISVTPEDSEVTVTVSTDRQLAPNEFTLDNPPRLVLDFPNTINRVQFSKLPVEAGSVKQLRVQQFQSADPKIARVVLDLDKGFGTHEIALEKNSVRIVVHPAEPEPSSAANISEADLPADQGQGKSEQIIEAGLPEQVPTVQESPEPAAADNDFLSTESRTFAGDSDAQMPLIAALAPPVLSTVTPTMAPLPNSRFTGQPLTLDLIDIPLVDFFRLMAEEGGINIVMDPQVQGKISIKVVKVPWDQIFDAALTNNGLDKQVEGSLVRIARKTTLQDEAKQRVDTLADQKTARGTIDVDERTNSLILTDLSSSLDKLVDLVETLDIAQPQVEIEARIVSATRDFARDIGIQFGFVSGNLQRVTVGGPNTFGTIGGTRPSATPKNTYSAGNPFTGRGASESSSTESAGTSTGANNDGNYNVNVPSQKPWGGVGISVGNIFDTFLLDAAITAGESKGSAKLISQPKVTAQNNSAATITQGLRFPVQIIANNTITVQFQNAALTLTVTPQITYEGNIILDLKVENNTPDFGRQVNGIPSIRTSESTTRVLVSDGGTTVIGGILIDDEGTQRDQVPGLGSLPVIGNLFKRNAVSRSTQEVLFFVTPRVVK